jgi:hypothetical protein
MFRPRSPARAKQRTEATTKPTIHAGMITAVHDEMQIEEPRQSHQSISLIQVASNSVAPEAQRLLAQRFSVG